MAIRKPPRWTYEIPKNAVELCNYCKHRSPLWPDEITCAAFPDGIPKDVLICDIDHRKPVEGDHGIQFEPDEDRIREVEAWAKKVRKEIEEFYLGVRDD